MSPILSGKTFRISLVLAAVFAIGSPLLAGGAKITIVNANDPNVGFNDPTPATPLGGNPGTTLGQQRLIAFQRAADIWGSLLDSRVEIRIQASFIPLDCTVNTAVLGAAGAIQAVKDFSGAEFPSTWYPIALANKRAGTDLIPGEPKTNADDIRARFNVNLGKPDCFDGAAWYYGLDNDHGPKTDLISVVLHELAHGLGFSSFVNLTTGSQLMGQSDVFERRILDSSTGKHWDAMTDAERVASSLNVRRVVWDGPQVTAAVPSTLDLGTPLLTINSPAAIAGDLAVGTASFGPPLPSSGLVGMLVQAQEPLACSALSNAAEVSGRIALVDRGTCTFVVKVKNAQNAGAIGVVVADNVEGSPPSGMAGTDPTITIPSVRIAMGDGATLKANLQAGVSATLRINPEQRAGADPSGRALLNATNPVSPGSSIHHWDPIASPNLLMEPVINVDLTQSVDLTLPQLRDIGWFADRDLDGVADDIDNCPGVANPGQEDANHNGIGDACERVINLAPNLHGSHVVPPRP